MPELVFTRLTSKGSVLLLLLLSNPPQDETGVSTLLSGEQPAPAGAGIRCSRTYADGPDSTLGTPSGGAGV